MARTLKFNQKVYKTIKLKVTEIQIDQVIQIAVVKKVYMGGGNLPIPPPSPFMPNRVKSLEIKRS